MTSRVEGLVVWMRSIPVRDSAFAGLVCVMAPEAKLLDMDTGEVKKDRRSGQTVWTVGVCAMRGRDSSVIQIAVVGEPGGLGVGMPVRVVDLEATPWERDGRSGIAWRAEKVLPAVAPSPAPTAGAQASGGKERP
jgi:hypothetical protein